MDLIKTGIGLTKTIKNVSRIREILTVFSNNGFGGLIIRSGLGKLIPGFALSSDAEDVTESQAVGSDEWWGMVGVRLRKSFEQLGPSFIKVGQLLATREDLLDPNLIRELKLLQNKVKPIPFLMAKECIETSLGKPIHDIFERIDEDPIGTASIGVVYRGRLRNGVEVVIKVRRPGIAPLIKTDFEILNFIVTQVERASSDIRYLGMSKVIADFFKSTMTELNFQIEATNCERLRSNLKSLDKEAYFKVPQVYREYSTQDVLVMEFLDGRPFNEFTSLEELGPDMVEKLLKSVELFTRSLLADGFFHADLHGGNFFVLKNRQIGLIDFGLMGTLSKRQRANLIAILYAVTTRNFDNLVYEFLEVADYDEIPDHEELIRDLADNLSPYLGLSVQETDMTALIRSLVRTLSKHRLYLPREWFIVFRALVTLDGVGKSVGLDLNIFKILEKEIPHLLQEVLSKESAQEELLWLGKDVASSLRILPKHMKWFLKEVSRRDYALALEVRDADKHVKSVSRSLYFLGLAILASVFLVCGTLFVMNRGVYSWRDVPGVSWVFWAMALMTLLRGAVLKKY